MSTTIGEIITGLRALHARCRTARGRRVGYLWLRVDEDGDCEIEAYLESRFVGSEAALLRAALSAEPVTCAARVRDETHWSQLVAGEVPPEWRFEDED